MIFPRHRLFDVFFTNEIMNFLFNINVCRVCMQNEQSVDLLSDSDLQQKFTYTTKLTISEKDNLPKAICSGCAVRLKVAHKFIKTAHESETNLRNFLAKISNEFKEVAQGNKNEKTEDNTTPNSGETLTENEILTLISDDDPIPTTSRSPARAINRESTYEKRKNSQFKENDRKKIKKEVKISTNHEEEEFKMPQITGTVVDEKQISMKTDAVYDLTEDILLIHSENNEINFENSAHLVEECQNNVEDDEVEEVAEEGDIEEQETEVHQALLEGVEEDGKVHSIKTFIVNEEESLNAMPELSELNLQENHLEALEENSDEIQNIVSSTQDGYLREYETMLNNQVADLHYSDEYVEENSVGETPLKECAIYIDDEASGEDVEEGDEKRHSLSVVYSTATVQRDDQIPRTSTRKESQPLHRFYCTQCNRDFSTKTNLNRHMQSHEGNKPHVCPECSKSFSQKSTLKQHMYTHTGEKPYVCDVCNRGFTQCKSLIFHMRRHTGEKPFQCEYCLVMFRQKDALRIHILKHHVITEQLSNGTEVYICIICQMKFDTKSEFKIHMKIHTTTTETENIEFITDEPSENTLFKAPGTPSTQGPLLMVSLERENLDAAVMDVSASSAAEPRRAKKLQCRKCFKCFVLKKSLIRHMRIHYTSTEEEITDCIDCDIQFENAEDYQEHLAERHQVVCSECPDLIFKNMQDLKEHMYQHSLEQQEANELK